MDSERGRACDAALSRRDFLLRAAEIGCVLSLAPGLHAFPDDRFDPSLLESLDASVPPSLYSGLRWRMLGPFRGGRVAAATGVAGRPHEFYFGAVNGGVWKSIDGGRVWTPIFDSQSTSSIGAIAVAPSAPDTVYVGSGESTLRDSVGYGNGMYKSIDAGRTWVHLGLDETHHIGKVAVDPRNPDIVLSLQSVSFTPPTRSVVYSARETAAEPVLRSRRPIRVASTRSSITRHPSHRGLSSHHLALLLRYLGARPAQPPPGEGGLYRSDDAGATWTKMSGDIALWGRGWYFNKVAVDPTNADLVYVPPTTDTSSSLPTADQPGGTSHRRPSRHGAE